MAASVIPRQRVGVFRSLAEAIRGTQQDFTEGSIRRAVFLLATPMVLEMFMESLFAIVDVFWVTRLGSNAVATVGLTETVLTLVISVAYGVSMSTTAMVSRRMVRRTSVGLLRPRFKPLSWASRLRSRWGYQGTSSRGSCSGGWGPLRI